MATEKGKGKTVYVGGFDETVNEQVLYATFTPFGDVVDVQVPNDMTKSRSQYDAW